MVAWWIFMASAKLPFGRPSMLSRPSIMVHSHGGRVRSSGRECSRATWVQNCRQSFSRPRCQLTDLAEGWARQARRVSQMEDEDDRHRTHRKSRTVINSIFGESLIGRKPMWGAMSRGSPAKAGGGPSGSPICNVTGRRCPCVYGVIALILWLLGDSTTR
jgi:endogenous inhibitor of DNA gyrase (YacG/DUF329 family)